jgi:hypothetical protein
MSEIKVNKISPRTACGTTTLGDSGDTFTIPAGVSITNSGTASGFGSTGEVSWVTTKKTTGFTVTAGEGYFCDTSSGGFTVTLPAGTAGNSFAVADYTNTFQTGNLVITPNGTNKIGGVNASVTLNTEGQSAYFVYVDDTEGWKNVIDSTSNLTGGTFIGATGGNAIVTCGNFKTHIFTGPGTFCVASLSSCSALNKVDYLVVAGGGGGGGADNEVKGGGGGAGGVRFFSTAPGNNSPLNNSGASPNTEITVTATAFPITVGAAGSGAPSSPPANNQSGTAGGTSTFSTVTSAGGGIGGSYQVAAGSGGSGGGAGTWASSPYQNAGSGNNPPVAPVQGFNGGVGNQYSSAPSFGVESGGGGGGAGAVGTTAPVPADGSQTPGGAGSYIADSFVGPTAPSYGTPGPVSAARYFGGGGGGGQQGCASAGGAGGGGTSGNSTNSPAPAPTAAGQAATINTGGGGGGAGAVPAGTNMPGGGGGSGIVMIRYKFQ